MFYQISTWVVLLASASSVLASPVSPSIYKRSAETDLVGRGFGCPPDIPCGPGPECAGEFCDLPACADAEECQGENKKRSAAAALADRQLPCPPGLDCGPGPECTPATCGLPGCADADVCQSDNDKRSAEMDLVDRGLGCPPDIPCGPGPVCTAETCDLAGCADADVCQNQKRSAETDIVHPVCDICIVNDNGATVCGCATTSGGPERRDADKLCPEFCITTETGETLCGCAAESYLQGNPPKA